jgi:hypothetical protein
MATRRELIIGAAALATYAAARKAGAATTGFNDQDYRHAIVIDGLGGFDDPYGPPEATAIDRARSQISRPRVSPCRISR